MTDVLLLAGALLALLSLVVAAVQLMSDTPPRAAAILLVAGIGMIFLATWLSPWPVGLNDLPAAWGRLTAGLAGA